jgi:DNA mismatch endonuclease, patch repair protein
MQSIKGKNTVPEVALRSALHMRGHRFRIHDRSLPGTPDIVFRSRRIAIFVDGDFWHGYRFTTWCARLTPFWRAKIEANIRRDRANFRRLRGMGWRVIRVWEHQVNRSLEKTLDRLEIAISVDKPHTGS